MPLIPSHTVNEMALAADQVIGNVLLRGSFGMKAAPRTEVGFVAAVTLGGIKDIADAWQSLLAPAGSSLKATGVFCHAAPLVRFPRHIGNLVTCELADLLIVVDWLRPVRSVRVASLIQAKMAAKAKRVSLGGPSSVRQLLLYQQWPLFTFVDRIYGTNTFNLGLRVDGEAGTFGIIDRHFKRLPSSPPIWTQHFASPTPMVIKSEPSLGTFMANMAAVTPLGFGRRARPGGKDDWSKVVDLLLKVTYAKTFRHTATLESLNPWRGKSAVAFMLNTTPERQAPRHTLEGWGPPFDGFDTIEDDSPSGISVLHLIFENRDVGSS